MNAGIRGSQPVDEISRYMHEVTKEDSVSTVYERFAEQQPQCGFGSMGICCTLCTDGPCQITRKASKGVCGATADLIVARNLLQKCAQGTVANVYHTRNVARTLKAVGEGRSDYEVKDETKLRNVAGKLGLDISGPTKDVAISLGDFFIDQINSNDYQPLKLVEAMAPKKRLEIWRKLGIVPGGPNSEAATLWSKTMTNVNNDPVDLLLHGLRLGIANEYAGLFGITTLQEILIGTSNITEGEVNIGILDPLTINIIAHGHQPLLALKVLDAARDSKLVEKAKGVGAKGIKVYGSLCEGQQLLNISNQYKDVFMGQIGNWIQQEFVLATGAVDLMFFDYNCVMPSMVEIAKRYHTKLISTDKVMRHAGVERLEFEPDNASDIAGKIVNKAIEAFTQRGKIVIPTSKTNAMVGFTTESVVAALGGSVKPLIDAIANGSIKGITAVIGCTTVRESQSGKQIIELVEELIKRDILVIGAGCVSSTLQNVGLMEKEAASKAGGGLSKVCESLGVPPCLSYGSCTDIGKIIDTAVAIAAELDVDLSQLPIAVSAPEYMEQKAVADAFTAVAMGLMVHLAPAPPVLGSPLVTKVLTQDIESLVGGKILIELDPVKAADAIEQHIHSKREALNLAPVTLNTK